MKTQIHFKPKAFNMPVKVIGTLFGMLLFMLLSFTKTEACSANFTWQQQNNSYKVNFTNTSSGAHSNWYVWYFGNPAFDSVISTNPSYTFSATGSYDVTLVVRDTTGCVDTVTKTITVYPSCDAGFSVTKSGLKADFSVKHEVGRTYYWDFGDGDTSSSPSPSHTYASPGNYYVTLKVTTGICLDTSRQYISIADTINCNAGFTVSYGSGGQVTFTNTSTTNSPNLIYYNYYFGDGNTHSTNSLFSNTYTHTYDSNKAYVVTLYMQDSLGRCSGSFKDSVIVGSLCNSDFNWFATYLDVGFSPSGTQSSHAQYTWSFGDGTSSNNKGEKHTYSQAGSYNVCLTVTDTINNCIDSTCKLINVTTQPKCTASFSVNISGLNISLQPDTAWFGYSNATYYWTFSDNTNSSSKVHFNKAFSSAGTYVICLYVVNGTCSTSVCDTIVVTNPPQCHAAFNMYPNGLSVKLEPFKTWNGYSNASFYWTFSDSTTSTDKDTFTKVFPSDGTYTVCLYVTNGTCTTYTCDSITVTTPTYQLGGDVHFINSTNQVDKVMIYLITYNAQDTTISVQDSTTGWDSSGITRYVFGGLAAGTYYVKAALTSNSSYYSNYLPTFHDSELIWSDADAIVITNATQYADVYMIPGTNPGGPGFISGKVVQGQNKKEGDPLENILVLLYDDNRNPVAYTYTDADGVFKFENLALGTYEVYTEVTGLPTVSGFVTLTEQKKSVETVEVKVSSTGITTSVITIGIKENEFAGGTKLYPNPVTNNLYFDIETAKSHQVTVSIYNTSGKCLQTETANIQAGKQTLNYDVKHFPAGLYMLKLQTQNGEVLNYKFIKTE